MSKRAKYWQFYDENDKLMMAVDLKISVPIGMKVKADGVDYTVWYVEEGRGGNNARLERVIQPSTTP